MSKLKSTPHFTLFIFLWIIITHQNLTTNGFKGLNNTCGHHFGLTWPLTHKGLRSLFGLANYYHHFIQDFSKVARILPDLSGKNGYPKSGMNFITKLLGSLRASCMGHPCSSLRNLINIFRCIWGRVILHWRSVGASWMAISFESMKLNGCYEPKLMSSYGFRPSCH